MAKWLHSPLLWLLAAVVVTAVIAIAVRGREKRAWGFKDVVKDPGYWDEMEKSLRQVREATDDAKQWDDEQVNRAVTAFLFEAASSEESHVKQRILEGLEERTHAQVLLHLADKSLYPRWVKATKEAGLKPPFHRACELLGDTPPPEAVPLLAPFLDDPAESIRKNAAIAIGKTGIPEIVPLLRKALLDPDDYVRSSTLIGLDWSSGNQRLHPDCSKQLFDDIQRLVVEQKNGRKSAEILFRFDPTRATEVFLSDSIFNINSKILHEALEVLANAKALIPRERLVDLIRQIEKSGFTARRKYIMGQALHCLGQHCHADDLKFIQSMTSHRDEEVANGASKGLVAWHGLEGFEQRMWEREEKNGYEGLNRHQQLYSAVFMLDAEINNGGLDQYFLNSSGDRWRDAVAGLEAMKSAQRLALLKQAIAKFGKDGPSTDRAERQQQLAKLARADEDTFETLNDGYYAIKDPLEVELNRFALETPREFE